MYSQVVVPTHPKVWRDKRSVSHRALPEFEPTEQRYEAGAQHAERLVARLKAVQDLQ